jgi:hypothetical protein
MVAAAYHIKPALGMTLTFKATPSDPLAGIPGRVIDIWPRFRSGDCLVTLEFEQPVKTKEGPIAHIDAFLSELCEPVAARAVNAPAQPHAGHWLSFRHAAR